MQTKLECAIIGLQLQVGPMPGKVFISYRREDTAGYAGRLHDRLKAAFPGRVFIDVGEIPPGADFVQAIEQHIEGCSALVALIGNNWMAHDRLQDPADFVRLEIAGALKRDISVVPALVGGAKLPAAATLPEEMRPLLRRQTISISDDDWDHGCERLVQALEKALGQARKPPHAAKRWALVLAVATVMVVGVVLFWKWRNPLSPNTSQAAPANMPETTHAAAEYDKSVAKSYDNATQKMGDVANQIGGAGSASAPTNGSVSPDTTPGAAGASAPGNTSVSPDTAPAAGMTITSISPDNALPGASVTITGTNFGANQGSVFLVPMRSRSFLFRRPAVVTSWGPTLISVQVPDITPGSWTVVVSVPGAGHATGTFTVNGSP